MTGALTNEQLEHRQEYSETTEKDRNQAAASQRITRSQEG